VFTVKIIAAFVIVIGNLWPELQRQVAVGEGKNGEISLNSIQFVTREGKNQ
jgi:hypothetical protein